MATDPISSPLSRLLSRLCARVDVAACESIADWLPRWRSAMAAGGGDGPFGAAVAAALHADRLAWAFFAGYQGALQAAFPAVLDATAPRIAALCANEAGRKPTEIGTALHAADGAFRLEGAKAWALAGIEDLELFVLCRAANGPPSGPGSLVVVRVSAGAAGVQWQAGRQQGVVPELPHAAVQFSAVRVEPGQVLAGDGHADHAKPFRLREDVFVTGSTLAFLLSHGHRAGWPSPWRQRCVAAITLLRQCAALPPSDPRTALLTAGALAFAGDLVDQVDGLWSGDDAVAAQRWQRDKPLLALGHEARRQRTLKAWAQVDAGAPGA